ncbi:MAG: sigma-70 family RNA polymerase sigma factor [Pseudorhizobium pelagicum]|uniref:RNA polymerase sigma factor n=1 Tax=Pseudorhizobium pelagicum TaxID=1509405 RepID=UPI00346166F3|tara:strand:- start:921 stop:1436 length:516 start_codon:yes stop_codon:yes gene_type:complete
MREDEIARCVEPLIPGLRRYAYSLVRNGDAADDLVQDCLERAVSRWHLRRTDGDLRAWLYAILRNHHLSAMRQLGRRGIHVTFDELTQQPSVEGGQGEVAYARDVLTALDMLSEEQRSVLLLVGVEDLSYEETSRVTGLPIGTVMSRLSRAREKLRRFIDDGIRPGLRRVK